MAHLLGLATVNGIKPLQTMFKVKDENGKWIIKRKGSVTIKVIHNHLYKARDMHFRCFRGIQIGGDPTALVTFGIPISMDTKGQYEFQGLWLKNERMFNLENEQDAITYEIMRHHEKVKGSPNSKNPWYEINDPELKAVEKMTTFNAAFDAGLILRKMADSEIREFGRLFALNPIVHSINIIRSKLMEICMTKPETIIDCFKDQEFTKAKQVFKLAESMGLIIRDAARGYMLRGIEPIGTIEDMAIRWLLNNIPVFNLLERESRAMEEKAFQKNAIVIIPESTSIAANAIKADIDQVNPVINTNIEKQSALVTLDTDDSGF